MKKKREMKKTPLQKEIERKKKRNEEIQTWKIKPRISSEPNMQGVSKECIHTLTSSSFTGPHPFRPFVGRV